MRSQIKQSAMLRSAKLKQGNKQGGFTLIELITVIAIITILAIVSLVAIPPFVIEGKVAPAAQELQRAMQRIKINAEGGGATPFTGINTAQVANLLRNGSIFEVAGSASAATASHSLKLLGSGVLSAAPATFVTAGDAYAITVSEVNNAACPNLAATMQKAAAIITINGTVVQNLNTGTRYTGLAASTACVLLDANTFVFISN
jgi:type IV pilus assembly protein PilA